MIGVYVNHFEYPNAEAPPPGDLEWSTTAELLGWLRNSQARHEGKTPDEPGETV